MFRDRILTSTVQEFLVGRDDDFLCPVDFPVADERGFEEDFGTCLFLDGHLITFHGAVNVNHW